MKMVNQIFMFGILNTSTTEKKNASLENIISVRNTKKNVKN